MAWSHPAAPQLWRACFAGFRGSPGGLSRRATGAPRRELIVSWCCLAGSARAACLLARSAQLDS